MEYSSEERAYVSIYQRPRLQLYECNVKSTHRHTVMKYVKLNRNEKWQMLTLTFLLYKIYILCFVFFNLKLTLYYCEVLLISVKPIVNNKDIDEYCLVCGLFAVNFKWSRRC